MVADFLVRSSTVLLSDTSSVDTSTLFTMCFLFFFNSDHSTFHTSSQYGRPRAVPLPSSVSGNSELIFLCFRQKCFVFIFVVITPANSVAVVSLSKIIKLLDNECDVLAHILTDIQPGA